MYDTHVWWYIVASPSCWSVNDAAAKIPKNSLHIVQTRRHWCQCCPRLLAHGKLPQRPQFLSIYFFPAPLQGPPNLVGKKQSLTQVKMTLMKDWMNCVKEQEACICSTYVRWVRSGCSLMTIWSTSSGKLASKFLRVRESPWKQTKALEDTHMLWKVHFIFRSWSLLERV